MEKGSRVHEATEFYDEGDLDEKSLDEAVIPYLEAYKKWREEMKPSILEIERSLVNVPYQYRGTCDRVIRLNGAYGVLDIKTGSPAKWHPVQLAAYGECLGHDVRRWSLYLRDDGTYQIQEHRDRNDWRTFIAALAIHNWKVANGI